MDKIEQLSRIILRRKSIDKVNLKEIVNRGLFDTKYILYYIEESILLKERIVSDPRSILNNLIILKCSEMDREGFDIEYIRTKTFNENFYGKSWVLLKDLDTQ